ncbi:hypothetical protein G9A89_015845 [Geosiphon pyriformis]|nr:hypothetical protein G9A89_015845 [Geosiphon pyriformis]
MKLKLPRLVGVETSKTSEDLRYVNAEIPCLLLIYDNPSVSDCLENNNEFGPQQHDGILGTNSFLQTDLIKPMQETSFEILHESTTPHKIFYELHNHFYEEQDIANAIKKHLIQNEIKFRDFFDDFTHHQNEEPETLNFLGFLLTYGIGCTIDEKNALLQTKKAADLGSSIAQSRLGIFYQNDFGVKSDYAQSFFYLEKAANAGHVFAQTFLGTCYKTGVNTTREPQLAILWLQKAAKAGDPKAQHELGLCYHHGFGIARNDEIAFQWHLKAAENHLPRAAYRVAYCYKLGIRFGTPKNLKLADEWFQKSADWGYSYAMRRVARKFLKGDSPDKIKGIYWLKKSAEFGSGISQILLAKKLMAGEGIFKDNHEALKWLQIPYDCNGIQRSTLFKLFRARPL